MWNEICITCIIISAFMTGLKYSYNSLKNIFTSCVSGRGNIFGSVRVCVSVCPSVCLCSAGRTVGPTDLKFGAHIKDYHISPRSKMSKFQFSA